MTETVYRATIGATDKYAAALKRARDDRDRALAGFLLRNGFPDDAVPLLRNGQALITSVYHLGAPPEGWRTSREDEGVVVPDRRTQQGRRAAEELAAIPAVDRHRLLPGGMPACAFSDRGLMEPRVLVLAGRLLAAWPQPLAPRDVERLDPAVWEPVPAPHLAHETAPDKEHQ